MSQRCKGTTSNSIHELNIVNEAAHFDQTLANYFCISNSTSKHCRKHEMRCRSSQFAPDNAVIFPETPLKQLKRLLRDATTSLQSQYIQKLYAMITYQLKRAVKSPNVFAKVLILCQEIFKRSAVFRALIVTQSAAFFDQLLVAAGESPSANVSKALRVRSRGSKHVKMVLMLIEMWKQDFGNQYPSLEAGYAILLDRGYEFPNERERLQQKQKQEVDTVQNLKRVSSVKKQQRDREMKRYVPEIEHVLIEMNRAFDILVPTLDNFTASNDVEEKAVTRSAVASSNNEHSGNVTSGTQNDVVESNKDGAEDEVADIECNNVSLSLPASVDEEEEDIEWENVVTDRDCTRDNSVMISSLDEKDVNSDQMDINDIVKAYGLGSSSYHLTVEVSKQICEESSENDALFQSLADGALRIRKRFIPLLDDWEQTSTTTSSTATLSILPCQRQVLQQICDLRDRTSRVLLQWEDLMQGSRFSMHYNSTRSEVVSLPLDTYNKPLMKRKRYECEQ